MGFVDKVKDELTKTPQRKVLGSLSAVQFSTMALAPVCLLLTKGMFPGEVKWAKEKVAQGLDWISQYTKVEPYFEHTMTPQQKEPWEALKEKPSIERMRYIADSMTEVIMSGGYNYVLSLVARHTLFPKFGLHVDPKTERRNWYYDCAVNMGSIIMVPTLLAKESDIWKKHTANFFKKFGLDETTANGLAVWAINLKIPDLAGFVTGISHLSYVQKTRPDLVNHMPGSRGAPGL